MINHPHFQNITEDADSILYHFSKQIDEEEWIEFQIIEPLELSKPVYCVIERIKKLDLIFADYSRESESFEEHPWIIPLMEDIKLSREDRLTVRRVLQ